MGIKAIFYSGKEEEYTTGMLDLLESDRYVKIIIDLESGKILYKQEV